MSLIPTDVEDVIDLPALNKIARTVEGAVADKEGDKDLFKQALDNNGASLDEVAATLARQLIHSEKETTRQSAIRTILEVHGMVGAKKDSANKGDINIVIHSENAQVQANQMLSPQRTLGDPQEHNGVEAD